MASIEKRGNSFRFSVFTKFVYKKDETGKLIRDKDGEPIKRPEYEKKTIKRSDLPEAIRYLTDDELLEKLKPYAEEFEQEVKNGKFYNDNLSLADYAELWYKEYAVYELDRNTLRSYVHELNTKILPALGKIKLVNLKKKHIRVYLQKMSLPGNRIDGKLGCYSKKTLQYQLTVLSSLLNTAENYFDLITDNPAIGIKVPKPKEAPPKRKNGYFEEEALLRFLNYIESEPPKYKLLYWTVILGGLRRGEVLGIQWKNVDFKNNVISIEETKQYSERESYIKGPKTEASERLLNMPSKYMKELKEYKLISCNSKFLFDMHCCTPRNRLKKIIDRYNLENPENPLPHVTLHGLRSTTAVLLTTAPDKIDSKTISGRLGHSNISTTYDIYTHFLSSQDRIASTVLATKMGLE